MYITLQILSDGLLIDSGIFLQNWGLDLLLDNNMLNYILAYKCQIPILLPILSLFTKNLALQIDASISAMYHCGQQNWMLKHPL